MSNKYHNVLYVGVTNDLVRRVAEHKAKINKGFTHKYNADKLVYFEQYQLMTDAIAREKQLKNWKRKWKDALVIKENPEWNDLSESIGVNSSVIPYRAATRYLTRNPLTQQEIAGQARNDVTKCGYNSETMSEDVTRKEIESQTGQKVVSPLNARSLGNRKKEIEEGD